MAREKNFSARCVPGQSHKRGPFSAKSAAAAESVRFSGAGKCPMNNGAAGQYLKELHFKRQAKPCEKTAFGGLIRRLVKIVRVCNKFKFGSFY